MASAKDIVIKPITAKAANDLVKKVHYSGKVVQNSSLHFGAFLNGKLEGVMSFGPSLDKRRMLGTVDETGWNSFLELNRMAFSDKLPRNSESRAISIAFKIIKKSYPNIDWVVSFSDGSQCGDGAIYRASGFDLIGIKENSQIIEFPDGLRETRLVLTDSRRPRRIELAKRYGVKVGGGSSLQPFLDIGAKAVAGFQLKYIYFLNKEAKKRLTVPTIPFSKIDEMGAGMYKGKPKRVKEANSGDQSESGGATPTHTLQSCETSQ